MLNPDFRDMLSALNDVGAEFLVVGAYALAAHGLPRATGDIDIWVRPSTDNADRVLDALRRFGAPTGQVSADDLCVPNLVLQIGVAPSRVDILTSIDGVEFDGAWDRRLVTDVDGLSVPILGRDDLLTNKRTVGRAKDLADVAWLEGEPE